MALTNINSEDRLVRQTFAEHLEKVLGWESVYGYCYPSRGVRSKYCISVKYLDRVFSM